LKHVFGKEGRQTDVAVLGQVIFLTQTLTLHLKILYEQRGQHYRIFLAPPVLLLFIMLFVNLLSPEKDLVLATFQETMRIVFTWWQVLLVLLLCVVLTCHTNYISETYLKKLTLTNIYEKMTQSMIENVGTIDENLPAQAIGMNLYGGSITIY